MELLKRYEVQSPDGPRALELLHGDLTAVPDNCASDVLVTSAFPGDYLPTKSSLIGALDRAGLSVADLSRRKQFDLRKDFDCWLSEPIAARRGLPFKYLLCLESIGQRTAAEKVSNLFRALEPFAMGPPNITTVSIPFLETGNQGRDFEEMAQALLLGAWGRLSEGHPLKIVRIVERDLSKAARARSIFDALTSTTDVSAPPAGIILGGVIGGVLARLQTRSAPITKKPAQTADVFVSYSRRNQTSARLMADCLQRDSHKVFLDERSIDTGAAWQREIFEALESCRCALVLYSPDFVSSKVCQDEFAAAMILRRRRGDDFIFPVLVQDTDLPAYMEMLNYFDCRIENANKLTEAAARLSSRLQS